MKRISIILVACMALLGGVAAQDASQLGKARRQTIYMFGVAASMTDSVSYITDLQIIDAYMQPNGFLADRSLYALQLNNYAVGTLGKENMTCAVFFSKSKSKAEKKFQKVRKKYRQNPAAVLVPLGVDRFRFEPEEWINSALIGNSPEASHKTKKKK